MRDRIEKALHAVYVSLVIALFIFAFLFMAAGCGESAGWSHLFQSIPESPAPSPQPQASESLSILTWTGAIASLFGIVSMVFTSGRIGLRAVIGGVGLIALAHAIALWASFIFLPAIGAIGAVSVTWGVLTIRSMILARRNGGADCVSS